MKSALDRDSYPPGPDGLATMCRERVAELEVAKVSAPKSERKTINRQLQTCRMLLRLATTRAGYYGNQPAK